MYLLPEALLLCLAEVHSSASWTGCKLHRPSTRSGASVWKSPDDFFAHKKAEYVILTALSLQHCVSDLHSMLRCMYIGCLVGMDLCIYSLHLMVLLIFNKESKFYDSYRFYRNFWVSVLPHSIQLTLTCVLWCYK